jgi:hypothetical protein
MENTMRRTILMAAAVMLASPLMLGEASAAGTAIPQMKSALTASATGSVIEKAGWRRCHRWNRKCHRRWGWNWRYRRCMRRHGC